MVWFLVDDVLPFHERVLRAGNAAMGLWVRGGAWCSGQLTDGFISAEAARTMGTAAEIRKLVQVGLWSPETRDGQVGYLFHAWAEDGTGQKRQPTKAEVEEKRRKERERKAKQRESHRDAEPTAAHVPPSVPVGHTLGLPGGVRDTRPDQAINPLLAALEGAAPPVNNSGENPEPPSRCLTHLGLERPPRCGLCKDARVAHEAWEQQQEPAAPPPRVPRWDPATHCEHGQLHGACDACDYEQAHAATILRPIFGVSA